MGRRSGFEAGLSAAEHVDAFGVRAGTPVRAAGGALTVAEGDGVVALLHRVPGAPCARPTRSTGSGGGDIRLDPATGALGLVGWSAAGTGPLLADLAAAVLAAGGPRAADGLVDAYLRASRVPPDECEAVLPALLCRGVALDAAAAAVRIHADGGRLEDHAELTQLTGLYPELADAL
ncbi:hypothetical protein [Dactylosporangium sp. NPDC049140]|uniref:hypothetical protein n=1 Tax=Dactylosporangium sp. NPDC049140 TaxID=3155647 RepID=UPI0033FE6041